MNVLAPKIDWLQNRVLQNEDPEPHVAVLSLHYGFLA